MENEMIARPAQEVKDSVLEQAKYDLPFNPKQKGAVIGWLNKTLGSDMYRHIAMAWLFNSNKPISSKELTDGQWHGLHQWVKSYKDDAGEWQSQPCFPAEAALVLTEALSWYARLNRADASEFPRAGESMLVASVELGGVITDTEDEDGQSNHVNGAKFPITYSTPAIPPAQVSAPIKPKPKFRPSF